jgi:hypothetical protein
MQNSILNHDLRSLIYDLPRSGMITIHPRHQKVLRRSEIITQLCGSGILTPFPQTKLWSQMVIVALYTNSSAIF